MNPEGTTSTSRQGIRLSRRPPEIDHRDLFLIVAELNPRCTDEQRHAVGSAIFKLSGGGKRGFQLFGTWYTLGGWSLDRLPELQQQWESFAACDVEELHGIPTLRRLLAENGADFDAIMQMRKK
jgi:hypothetical protein